MNDGLQIGVVASQLLWYCSKKMQILEHMKVTKNFEFDSTHIVYPWALRFHQLHLLLPKYDCPFMKTNKLMPTTHNIWK
jgi:hypothetical protein